MPIRYPRLILAQPSLPTVESHFDLVGAKAHSIVPYDQTLRMKIEKCIHEVCSSPPSLDARLDLADALQQSRRHELASFVRLSCTLCDEYAPLEASCPTNEVIPSIRPLGYFRQESVAEGAEKKLSRMWERGRPKYWKMPQHCGHKHFFGRWTISFSSSDREQSSELRDMNWLVDANRDGLLELLEYMLRDGSDASEILTLPDGIRSLPLSINAAGAYGARLSTSTTRDLLSLPALAALYVMPQTFAQGPIADLPTLSPHLRWLTVECPRQSTALDSLLDALPSLPKLHYINLHGNALKSHHLSLLAKCQFASSLGLHHEQLTDEDLIKIGCMPSLKHLALNSMKITRRGILNFRENYPHVCLYLSSDMKEALGPT